MSSTTSEKAEDVIVDISLVKKKTTSLYFLTIKKEQLLQRTKEMEGVTCAL